MDVTVSPRATRPCPDLAQITLGGLTEQQKQTVMSSVDPWVEGLFLLPVPIFDEQRRKAFAARDRIKGVLSDAIGARQHSYGGGRAEEG